MLQQLPELPTPSTRLTSCFAAQQAVAAAGRRRRALRAHLWRPQLNASTFGQTNLDGGWQPLRTRFLDRSTRLHRASGTPLLPSLGATSPLTSLSTARA